MARVNTLPPAKPDDKVYETSLQIGARISSQTPSPKPKTVYPDLQNLPIDPAEAATAPYQRRLDEATDKKNPESSTALTQTQTAGSKTS